MACKASPEKELDDMTECSICTEVFTEPRVLPCIHTFCLKCLVNYGKDRKAGDNMPCPLCRKEYTIPDDGLLGIQKNFFMEKLLQARKLSAGEEAQRVVCDACRSDEVIANEDDKPASMYCVQCQQNYCEQCSRSHSRMKATADHVQMEIGKLPQKEEIVLKLPTTCDIHKDEEIKVFCLECKLAICMMCFIKSHKTHDCSDIAGVSVDLCKQAKSDIDKAAELLKKIEEVLPRFEKEKIELTSHLADIQSEINTAADKLIAAVQRDRAKLLSEVESIKLKRVKQLETVKQEVEQHMTALESFKRYGETLVSSGTACDVTRSANSLHERADELMMFDVIGHVDSSLPPVSVTFTSSAVLDTDAGNILGHINGTDTTTISSRTVTHTIGLRGDKLVGGITSFGDDVFVLRSHSKEIDVYSAATFILQRRLAIPLLGSYSFGLAVCASNKCLYASDYYNSCIHRVELFASNAVMKWSVARSPAGLTVNSANNLLVVSLGERKLQEFTTRGTLLQNIQLQTDIKELRGVVEVRSGQFAVSYEGSVHGVCLVDVKGGNGMVLCRHDGSSGSGLAVMKRPRGLAVDKHGNILVADRDNNRLLVLDHSLTSANGISLSVDGGLKDPYSLWYDKSRGRLYVGEGECLGGRVIVIDHVKDFTASHV